MPARARYRLSLSGGRLVIRYATRQLTLPGSPGPSVAPPVAPPALPDRPAVAPPPLRGPAPARPVAASPGLRGPAPAVPTVGTPPRPAGLRTLSGRPAQRTPTPASRAPAPASPPAREPTNPAEDTALLPASATRGRGLEPNQAPAEPERAGTPAHVAQAAREYREHGTRSKAFLDWFGDWINDPANASKVVDRQTGEPQETHRIRVVYHGTAREFPAFDPERTGRNGVAAGRGLYFAENRDIAARYARWAGPGSVRGGGGHVVEAYLNIRNPFDFDRRFSRDEVERFATNVEDWSDRAPDPLDLEEFHRELKGIHRKYRARDGSLAGFWLWQVLNVSVGPEHSNRVLGDFGYDGVLHESMDMQGTPRWAKDQPSYGRVWVAFRPNQAKSVQNRGTFDPDDDRIKYAEGEDDDMDEPVARYRLAIRPDGRLVVRYAKPRPGPRRDRQGGIVPADRYRAQQADLVTLPPGVPGTNCGNCRFSRPRGPDAADCTHPRMGFPVSTSKNCCAYWDNPGAFRAWR